MDMSTPKVAIVAALRREVWPLVKHWPASRKQSGGHEFAFYEKGQTVVVCGGIGGGPARRATEAVIQLYRPDLVISAGFAGALQAGLPVGRVLTPRIVVDTRDGSRASAEAGEGVLVSFDSIADVPQKAKLAEAYAAQAVDMEAAAVARAAETHGLRFMACKVISDASDFSLPPTARFVRHDGQFQSARFAFYAAMRPWLWRSVLRLSRDTAVASRSLCRRLKEIGEITAPGIRTDASQPVFQASAPVKS
jgi:adenosylhomocysteine nucleosidase